MNLAGDIGGTNARFALWDAGRVREHRLPVAGLTADELLDAAMRALDPPRIANVCLAVAGPVLAGEARLTNVDMTFSGAAVQARTGAREVALVNDIVAMGAAVAAGLCDGAERLGGRAAEGGDAVRAVVAAGTGLGMGLVMPDGRCLPSEGGHVRVAPADAFERELVTFTETTLEEARGVVAWEHYLSGRGLVNLYRAVSHVWGMEPAAHTPEEVTRRGLEVADPICHTTLETWAGMLGTAAGGLAVTAMALGGVWLAGTIPRTLAPVLRERVFRRRFEEAAWAADFLADVPVHLLADDDIGLKGAAAIAARLPRS